MRDRLQSRRGRRGRTARRTPRPGCLPAALDMDPPWSLRIQDEAPLTLIAIVRGRAWIVPETARGPLGPGTSPSPAAPTPTPSPTIRRRRSRPSSIPGSTARRSPASRSSTSGGPRRPHLGQLRRRHDGHGHRDLHQFGGEVSQHLLRALPGAAGAHRREEFDSPLDPARGARGGHARRARSGGRARRLLDLLLIAVLRAWFARPEADTPGWYRAHADPIVGAALRLLHHNPAHEWTVGDAGRARSASPRGARAALQRTQRGTPR